MTTQELCDQYGLDQNSVQCLLDFLRRALEKPEAQDAFLRCPNEFVRAGVEAWYQQGKAFYEELLEGKTYNAKKYRAAIAHEVWVQANQTKGVSV